jgi:hypothetical protein
MAAWGMAAWGLAAMAACAPAMAGDGTRLGGAAASVAAPGEMSRYVDPTLKMTLTYPGGFAPRVPETLRAVLKREHMTPLGSGETDDVDSRVAFRCMATLFEATGAVRAVRSTQGETAPDTVMLLDVDRSCVEGQIKGERALAVIADVVLRMHNTTPLVKPTVMKADGHRVHAGMSSGMMIVNDLPTAGGDADNGRQAAVYIVAAAFEHRQHWLLAVYISGTAGEQDGAVGRMTATFDESKPVVLFPFLPGGLAGAR